MGEVRVNVGHLNATFPRYPVTVEDKGWVYGTWYCTTAWMRTHFHGQYPLTYLNRVLALFPDAKSILHCPSGTVTGPGITVDLIRDRQRRPQVMANAEALPFADGMFDLYISDPPYTPEDSADYGCPPWQPKRAMAEAWRVLRSGGYYCLLNTRYPSFSPRSWNLRGLIGVVTGANRVMRLLSLFERLSPSSYAGNEAPRKPRCSERPVQGLLI